MNHDWDITSAPTARDLRFSTEQVLVEYDGPQVITARDQYDNRYLAVAVDDSDDNEVVRWLYSQISDLEYESLLCGALTVRDALLSDTVLVVDKLVNGGRIDAAWRASSVAIPVDALPAHDSVLPPSVREKLMSQRALEPQMRVAGKFVQNHLISFADLGYAVTRLQELWHTLYGHVYFKTKKAVERAVGDNFSPYALLVAGTGPGSFAIKIRPQNETIYNRLSEEYSRLLASTPDENQLRDKFGSDVVRTYSEYVSFLDARKLEVLTTSQKTAAYIGPKKTARIVGVIGRPRVRLERPPADVGQQPTTTIIGHFEGYSYLSKRFDFVADGSGEVFTGTVEESVLTGNPIERGLVLSSKTLYTAEIRIGQKADRPTYTLLGFWRYIPPTES